MTEAGNYYASDPLPALNVLYSRKLRWIGYKCNSQMLLKLLPGSSHLLPYIGGPAYSSSYIPPLVVLVHSGIEESFQCSFLFFRKFAALLLLMEGWPLIYLLREQFP